MYPLHHYCLLIIHFWHFVFMIFEFRCSAVLLWMVLLCLSVFQLGEPWVSCHLSAILVLSYVVKEANKGVGQEWWRELEFGLRSKKS